MLSAYLGRYRVQNVCLERDASITTDPRGIALDEDGIRLLQGLGLYDKIYTEIGQCMGRCNFISGTQQDLSAKPILSFNPGTSDGGTGHVGVICHNQPVLEKYLRDAATSQSSTSEIRSSANLNAVWEDDNWVYVEYEDGDGSLRRLRSKFLVGADGKTGFVRKRYLEPKGVHMEQVSEVPYEEVWVAMNWKMILPTPETHPTFPLWNLGYTPEEVYDAFFPKEFRFLCNPSRPSVCSRFGLDRDRLWRFEFVVQEGEDGNEMAKPEKVKDIVWPYLRHPGSRYGISQDVVFPEDCVQSLRCRPFRFNARSCNMYFIDRVILVGDAAHVFPPYGGQGIVSGFRDASGLAWRLALACQSDHPDFTGLLRGWEQERKQQLKESIATTVHNGMFVNEKDPFKIFGRDWYLWFRQLLPSWKRTLEKGPRVGMIKYHHLSGMPFLPEMNGGVAVPQVYCRRVCGSRAPIQFSDDAVFSISKKALFQILVLLQTTEDLELAKLELNNAISSAKGVIDVREATFLIHGHRKHDGDPKGQIDLAEEDCVYSVATAQEFVRDGRLCVGRPEPLHYDEHRLWKDVDGKKFLVLRPDRFVFAACGNGEELRKAVHDLEVLVHSPLGNASNDQSREQQHPQCKTTKL
ncbi:MAG: hypothetical protein Q9165_007607 [Trypethelium subeluteriae]